MTLCSKLKEFKLMKFKMALPYQYFLKIKLIKPTSLISVELYKITVKENDAEEHPDVHRPNQRSHQYTTLLYLSDSMRAVIGQFYGPYCTVRPAKFELTVLLMPYDFPS